MGCTFCATGTMGFKGNLSTGDILEQLVHASRITPIRNVVFMVLVMANFHGYPEILSEGNIHILTIMVHYRVWVNL